MPTPLTWTLILPTVPAEPVDTPAETDADGDIRLTWRYANGAADTAVVLNDLARDAGLRTAVMVSLFTDRRAEEGDMLPDGDSDRHGWWGDEFAEVAGDKIGSRLWLLGRARPTEETAQLAKTYAEEALAWLVEDQVASAVEVETEIQRRPDGAKMLAMGVRVRKPNGDVVEYRFGSVWAAT